MAGSSSGPALPPPHEDQIKELLKALEEGREEDPIFTAHIEPLQEQLGHYGKSYVWQDDLDQTVCDFISAMTDDYFVALTERLFAEARDLFPKRGYFDGASLTLE